MSIPKKRHYNGHQDTMVEASHRTSPDIMDVTYDEVSYDSYLSGVLNDFGIQFSPGRSSIVEIPEDDFEPLSKDENVSSPGGAPSPSDLDPSDLNREQFSSGSGATFLPLEYNGQFEESQAPSQSSVSSAGKKLRQKKPKVYDSLPFEDEEMERKRLNAITAKKNRDTKKMYMRTLEQTLKSMKTINKQCHKALKKTGTDVGMLHQKIRHLEETLERSTSQIRENNMEIRRKRERMNLLMAHLDIIISGFDDHNPAKRIITTLLKTFQTEDSSDEFQKEDSSYTSSRENSWYT
ncbi:uncharacterized protein LOC121858785 [Homarus americanus]|uniref:BZIP domain-containing protein n=1 Tax=Homarus americanus TaxID=6706 RepID=A0A8J5TLT1_HOMAM|nr:uncharacterized protein LOC121858785 [Homarus americanus]XP_042211355.1 uncharacterized protein LOC121858785 [Homarus americanus]KAG7174887.1 hypothetical protein Hamer_G023319 [Homarus americanus]